MNIAFCYENVLPTRGGCETYIADLARRLIADRHEVHLYACRWDEQALPVALRYHRIDVVGGPRFLRPWRFARRCLEALQGQQHDVTVGFDKTYGQDVLYPQGGLHRASAAHNLKKFSSRLLRGIARVLKWFDVAHWSFSALERRQYLSNDSSAACASFDASAPQPPAASHRSPAASPTIIVNSFMVQRHFQEHYGIGPESVRV